MIKTIYNILNILYKEKFGQHYPIGIYLLVIVLLLINLCYLIALYLNIS